MHGVGGPCLGVGMAGMHGFLCTPCMPATYQKLQSNLGSGKVLFPTIDKIWAYCPIGSRMLYLFCALNIKKHFDHLSPGNPGIALANLIFLHIFTSICVTGI